MNTRRLEQSTLYPMGDGSTMRSDWEPFTGEGGEAPDTHGWKDGDYREFVRSWNKAAKARGDNTRLRSVENDDAFA
jgi:hypothetical protein